MNTGIEKEFEKRWSEVDIDDVDMAIVHMDHELFEHMVKAVKTQDACEIGRSVLKAISNYFWEMARETVEAEDGFKHPEKLRVKINLPEEL